MSDLKIKALRTIYAGDTPHAVCFTNLTKVPVGTLGTICESFIDTKLDKSVVYVVRFEVEDKCVFGFVNETSFEMIS